jgi:hypothetical protein
MARAGASSDRELLAAEIAGELNVFRENGRR